MNAHIHITMKLLSYVVLLVSFLGCVNCDGLLLQLERGIKEFVQTHKEPDYLQNVASEILKTKNKNLRQELNCAACKVVVQGGMTLWKSGASNKTVTNYGSAVCSWFSGWGREMCQLYVQVYWGTVIYIIDNKEDLTPDRVCLIRLWGNNCQDKNYTPWSVDLAPGSSSATPKASAGGEQSVVVHITDIHYDPQYEPGSSAVCNAELCCGGRNEKPAKPEDAAGYWGDYRRCDNPWHAVVDLMRQIKKQHPKIDWVYYTGDIVSHRSGTNTQEGNIEELQKVIGLMKDSFGDIPVYSILGNHEPHPSDLYSSENVTDPTVSTRWIFEVAATEWSRWLPNETKTTIRRGGYYTLLIKPGLRVIGLNSNVCYISNMWLIYNDVDPFGQLQWLANILAEAEKNNESVHILSHVPPDDSECWMQWIHEFRRIIERFSNTIMAIFNGHTHHDELRVIYSTADPKKVVNVAYNGGSFSNFVGLNPNYRVYEVDRGSHRVTDYEQWTFDLGEANKHPTRNPEWYKLYSIKEAYGMEGLELDDFHELLERMAVNTTLVEQYRRFQVRNSPVLLKKNCSIECLNDIYCTITKIEPRDSLHCKVLK